MKKIFFVAGLTILLSLPAFSQSSDDYHKNEVSGGYLYRQAIELGDTRFFSSGNNNSIVTIVGLPPSEHRYNGFNIAYTYNFHRYVGIKGEVSAVYNTEELPTGPSASPDTKISTVLTNYVAGIQIKDNSRETRVKPFVHALIGAGNESKKMTCSSQFCTPFNSSKSGLAAVIGGGIDIKLSNRIDLRAIQFDFNTMKVVTGIPNPPVVTTGSSNKYRIGIGIVFH